MSFKITGVSRDELLTLSKEIQLQPAFAEESCYIASGPAHEMLAVLQPTGLFDVQVLDKVQAARSVDETIKAFKQFVAEKELRHPE